MYIISRTRSRRRQMTMKLTGLSRTVFPEHGVYFILPFLAYNLEVVRRFSENLWILALVLSPGTPLPKDMWILLVTTHVRDYKSFLFLGSVFPGIVVRLVTIRKFGWAPELVRRGGEQGNSFLSWGSYRGHSACCQSAFLPDVASRRPGCVGE
jgi:hypothetical protein